MLCVSSRWIVTQQNLNTLSAAANDKEDFGQYPSYQDSFNVIFGCKHYKRNCKLLAACCNKLFTCIKCHDELMDHSLERYELCSFILFFNASIVLDFCTLRIHSLHVMCAEKVLQR